MSKKIVKVPPKEETSWGQDIFALVAAKSLGSDKLALEAEEAVEKRYRIEIRDKFNQDQRVYNALVESKECILTEGTYESISGLLRDMIRPGTEDIFERVLHELLEELDKMYKAEPQAYLIDRHSGKVVMPVTDKEIYTPPPYQDEAGIVHQSRPMLHPLIEAPMIMERHESARKSEAIQRATDAGQEMAVEHLIQGPDAILERARVLLRTQGIEVEPLDAGVPTTIEVGRERVDDMLQAPNYNFHRSQMYGSLLAKKVIDLLQGRRKCDLRSATLRKGSKEQWYEVAVNVVS